MRRTNLSFDRFHSAHGPGLAMAAVLLAAICPIRSMAQQPGQRTFSSAEDASKALVTAAQNNDEKAMLDIFGPAGKQVVSSGDDTEDAQNRANFVEKYQEMHRLVQEPDGTTTLYIGAENWPTPIPLISKGSAWYFHTEAGKLEILYRRIGQNETSTLRVCRELVAAQKEYRSIQHHGYARTFSSAVGQHNGLYWEAAEGELRSPIGPLVASAAVKGYGKSQDGVPTPFRGYFYRILTRQGKNAPGGAMNYIVNGRLSKGFAFVAFPAEYRSSGVMTFIVNQNGVVYEKDLGKNTDVLAKSMKEYNPTSSWTKVEELQEETVDEQAAKLMVEN